MNHLIAPTIQNIRCPNCGSPAERHRLEAHHLVRTQCSACDYLMVTSLSGGRVIEAYYAPGALIHR
ncbi:MAG: replication restart DNA helicase PriA [Prochlorothrix sp.]